MNPDALPRDWPRNASPAFGRPLGARVLRLRDASCPEAWLVFRIRITEWTYGTEAEAEQVAQAIAAFNHNGWLLKSSHHLWREGRRVFFAYSGATRNMERLRSTMERLGAPGQRCDHL